MTKKRTTKRALLLSALSILMCVSMLIGTTYAWFTDSVTSAGNIIKSGTLDVTMEWKDATTTGAQQAYKDASEGPIFKYDLWEPGYVEAKNVKITNAGSLALKYKLNILPTGTVSELANVIDVYFAEGEITLANRAMTELKKIGTLSEVLAGMPANMSGDLLEGQNDTVTIALKMQEEAGNEYQNKEIGSEFAIQLLATQLTAESDSFDDQYDKDAGYNQGKTNVGPYKLNVLSGGNAVYDEATNTYNVAVATVAQGGYNATQGGKYYAGYTVNVEGYGEGATLSFDKNGSESVWKLADEERDGFINNGIHQQWTSVGIARAYRYDIDGDGVTDFTVVNDASAAKVEVANAEQLKKVIEEEKVSAILVADINMDVAATGFTVANGTDVTIDLNGHDIVATSDVANASVQLFSVNGTLDIVGNGTISFTGDNFAWSNDYRYCAINIREAGVVTLGEGVEVVCEASKNGSYGMSYAVDIYTTGTLNVNGASLHSNYIAVRCFFGASVVNVNSGSITSSRNNWGIWPQSSPNAAITIANGIDYTTDEYGIYIFN